MEHTTMKMFNLFSLALVNSKIVFTVTWAKTRAGKTLAIVNGFTFYKDGGSHRGAKYFRCTLGNKCRARFVMNCGRFGSSNLCHHHNAPHYIINKGVYYKYKI